MCTVPRRGALASDVMSRLRLTLVAAILLGLTGLAPADAAAPGLEVVGSRADLVSGGDVLVRVRPGATVTANGRSQVVHGTLSLVTGLRTGRNVVEASGLRLVVTNHPQGGPVFSGPQVQPWTCTTEANGLGRPIDAQCDAQPTYQWFYKSAVTQQFASYDPARPAPDVATTTTDRGRTVPYVVRRERGTLNRGIYDVAVLADPAKPWTPWQPQEAWNSKLMLTFGSGCAPGHSQATPIDVLIDMALSKGYAVGQATTATMGNVCNTSVAAETVLMLKERIAEQYGPIRFTMGDGCSGGSETQNVLADRFPGLLDGVRPTCTFPDNWTPAIHGKSDCDLLQRYFSTTATPWTPRQRAAVMGAPTELPCTSLPPGGSLSAEDWDPSTGCRVPAPATRCTLQDYNVNALGRRTDGKANGVLDDVGVEWGLAVVREGAITVAQFVDLNASIGGWTIDYVHQPDRTLADVAGVQRMYLTGQLTTGSGVGRLPSIDARTDDTFDLHGNAYRDALRARVMKATGGTAMQVFWTEPGTLPSGLPTPPTSAKTFALMDAWLSGHRPAEARDGCVVAGQLVAAPTCAASHTGQRLPRTVAGGPVTADVLKCALTPLTRQGLVYTAAQWQRMQATFPTGVCDWGRPGVGQRAPLGTWISLAGTPHVLGPAPEAVTVPRAALPTGSELAATGLTSAVPLLGFVLMIQRRRRTSSANH